LKKKISQFYLFIYLFILFLFLKQLVFSSSCLPRRSAFALSRALNATKATPKKPKTPAQLTTQDIERDSREKVHMKAIARTVFKKSPSAAAAAAPVAPSVLNEAELTQILRTDVNDASTTLDADTAIDVEHDDDYDAFADIDEVDGTVPVDDDDDNRVLPFEAASFVTLEDEAEEEDFEEVDADDNDATTDAADAAGAAATNDANDVNDVNGVNDVNVTNVAEVPVVKKIRKRTVHPAAQIMRDFEEQVKGKRATFILVLGALQKLSIHDRPRSMMRVIRLAEHLGSVTPRQRMRMRYTLIAHNIMHHRYEKALRHAAGGRGPHCDRSVALGRHCRCSRRARRPRRTSSPCRSTV
jgi:hypothetical protein